MGRSHIPLSTVMVAAKELPDRELVELRIWMEQTSRSERAWCNTQLKESAPSALVVPV